MKQDLEISLEPLLFILYSIGRFHNFRPPQESEEILA